MCQYVARRSGTGHSRRHRPGCDARGRDRALPEPRRARAGRGVDQPSRQRPCGREPRGPRRAPRRAVRVPRARPALDRVQRGACLRENYGWHAPLRLPADAGRGAPRLRWAATPRSTSGSAAARRSGSTPGWRVEVLHLPGHTLGPPRDLGSRATGRRSSSTPSSRDGIYDRKGTKLIPSALLRHPRLRETIGRLQALRPEPLLTAHYPVLDRRRGSTGWLRRPRLRRRRRAEWSARPLSGGARTSGS